MGMTESKSPKLLMIETRDKLLAEIIRLRNVVAGIDMALRIIDINESDASDGEE